MLNVLLVVVSLSKRGFNKLSIDISSVMVEIKAHLLKHLEKAEDQLLAIMEQEVMRTTHGEAPGKPEWRKRMKERQRVVSKVVTDEYIESKVGLDSNVAFEDFVKTMVVTYGSGNRVGNGSIEAGPPGRMVWDAGLDGKKPSAAEGNWLLPDEFNQTGNHFIENSIKIMRKHYSDVLDEAAASLPSSVFYKNVHVKGGSR